MDVRKKSIEGNSSFRGESIIPRGWITCEQRVAVFAGVCMSVPFVAEVASWMQRCRG
jgi:hypothetical protein